MQVGAPWPEKYAGPSPVPDYDTFHELILIDDGSTQDDVAPYLDELEERFSARGWTIVRSTNMYLGAARNKAVTFR
jgi:hypothetical protein